MHAHLLDHVSARVEGTRLRNDLAIIDTAINTERVKIEDRDKALKVLNE